MPSEVPRQESGKVCACSQQAEEGRAFSTLAWLLLAVGQIVILLIAATTAKPPGQQSLGQEVNRKLSSQTKNSQDDQPQVTIRLLHKGRGACGCFKK